MNKLIFLLFAAAHYIVAIYTTYEAYRFGSESYKGVTSPGVAGGAISMGIISAALILAGSFFLYKTFQEKTVNK